MTAVRRIGALAAAGGLAAAVAVLPAGPAAGHGATTRPISRTAACATGAATAGSAACRAARKANGQPFGSFDNLRVPDVDGRDRQVIPDGHLCSGNLPAFAGLDLARDDWPATELTAGRRIDIRYTTTIPHRGTFRAYLTRPGYRPDQPLGWDDLGAEPFLTATDPPLRDGAYRMSGRLPAGRTGRHVLFVVWQNSSTPDTYYSCSDLVLTAAAGAAAAAPSPAAKSAPAARRAGARASRSAEPAAVTTAPPDATTDASRLARAAQDTRIAPGRQVAAAALIAVAGLTAGLAMIRIRRARAGRRPRYRRPPA